MCFKLWIILILIAAVCKSYSYDNKFPENFLRDLLLDENIGLREDNDNSINVATSRSNEDRMSIEKTKLFSPYLDDASEGLDADDEATNDKPKKMQIRDATALAMENFERMKDSAFTDTGKNDEEEKSSEEEKQLLALLTDRVSSETQSSSLQNLISNEANQSVVNEYRFDIQMPSTLIDYDDTYLCTAIRIPRKVKDTLYITKFIPHAQSAVAHHMLFFACNQPGTSTAVWNCGGEMSATSGKDRRFETAPTCISQQNIMWAWAMNAPELNLPTGVGFEVGPDTGLDYLVLQAHFKTKEKANANNNIQKTGLTVVGTTDPQPRVAGIYLSGVVSGSVPPHSVKNVDIVCRYNGITLHPFAFRVHTHALGVMVESYRVRNNKWTLIGREDPQKEEMFYPIKNHNLIIAKGDWLASRCMMKNFRSRATFIGSKHTDEMCNLYMMYWIPRQTTTTQMEPKSCWNGWPSTHWNNYFSDSPA